MTPNPDATAGPRSARLQETTPGRAAWAVLERVLLAVLAAGAFGWGAWFIARDVLHPKSGAGGGSVLPGQLAPLIPAAGQMFMWGGALLVGITVAAFLADADRNGWAVATRKLGTLVDAAACCATGYGLLAAAS